MDRVPSITYPDRTVVAYSYNSRGLLESVSNVITRLDYNPAGQNARLDLACGTVTAYQFDYRLRLKRLSTQRGRDSQALQDLRYTYDEASNITRIEDNRPDATLDALGAEIGLDSTEARKFNGTQLFLYDSLYRLTHAANTQVFGSISHRYDRIGNMLRQDAALLTADPMMDLGAMASGGNSGNHGHQGRAPDDPPGPHAITATTQGPGPMTFAYDANGNMTTDRNMTLTWDHKDRLIALTNDATYAEYIYDYTDRRILKTVTTSNQPFDQVVYIDKFSEIRNGRLMKYVYAGDSRIVRSDSSPDSSFHLRPSSFYLHDHLGSTALSLTPDATITEQLANYPFGHPRSERNADTTAQSSDYKFTGKERDLESDLQYFEARFLGSYIPRFMSVDPLAEVLGADWLVDPQKLNPPYTENRPVTFHDPSGNLTIAIEFNKNIQSGSYIISIKNWSIAVFKARTRADDGRTAVASGIYKAEFALHKNSYDALWMKTLKGSRTLPAENHTTREAINIHRGNRATKSGKGTPEANLVSLSHGQQTTTMIGIWQKMIRTSGDHHEIYLALQRYEEW